MTRLRERWDKHAQEWIDWVRSPSRQDSYWRFHREHFLAMVPAPGRLTLDVGCGEGRVTRDLRQNRHRVVGLDCSFTMCRAAAYYDPPVPVAAGDAARLPFANASVDCVVAFMSLQDIDDMRGTLREIARVLQDGRQLALAIVHPMYSGGKFSRSGPDQDEGFVIKASYFEPELRISHDCHDDLTVTFYREHQPLQSYVQALLDVGFNIEQWHEVTDQDVSKPWHRVPMFLDVLATRRVRVPAPAQRDDAPRPGSFAGNARLSQTGQTQVCRIQDFGAETSLVLRDCRCTRPG